MLSTRILGIPSALLWLLSLLAVAEAQLLPQRNYVFNGDSRVIADIAIWCITDIANIIITVLCFYPIIRLKGHRTTYICLCLSSFFTLVQASVEIGYIFFSHNGADIPNLQKQSGLLSAINFFGTWSSAFLYACLVTLLFDRAKQISRGALSPINIALFNCAFVYFAIILLVATIFVGLYAKGQNLENKLFDLGGTATIGDAQAAFNALVQAQNASFAFSGFWFFSTIIITALAISTYVHAKRTGVYDKITKNVLLFVVPLYYAAMIAGIVFTIFSSPSIVIINSITFENLDLANDLLTQFLYTGVMIVILVLGFKTNSWKLRDHAVALSTLGAFPSGGYVELDDPQK